MKISKFKLNVQVIALSSELTYLVPVMMVGTLAITDYTIYSTSNYYTVHAQTDADDHVPNSQQ